MKKASSLAHVYRGPAIVAVVTAVGLAVALFGDGLWDAFSWALLAIPLLLLLGFLRRGVAARP